MSALLDHNLVCYQASSSPLLKGVFLLVDNLAGIEAAILLVGNNISEAAASSAESSGMY